MDRRKQWGVLAAVVALAAGGGALAFVLRGPAPHPDAVTPEGTVTQGRLATIAEVYALHVRLRRRAPESPAELRAFAGGLPAQHGGPVTLADDRLTSARDGLPLAVRWGLPVRPEPPQADAGPPGRPTDGPVVAYEREGAGGRRLVVYYGSGRIDQVDEARFKELVP